MGVLTAARLVAMTDKLTAMLLEVKPNRTQTSTNSTVGIGDGTITPGGTSDYGCHLKLNDLENLILGYADQDYSLNLLSNAYAARNNFTWQKFMIGIQQFINGLNTFAAAAGLPVTVNTISDFATYYNTGSGGPFNCLFAPDFADLYNNLFGSSPMAIVNVYSPPITNMAQWVVSGAGTGTFTAGASVNNTLYGGVAQCNLTVTSFAGSAGTVTVTGTNHLGVTGRAWTVSVNGNGAFTLVPTVATDILQSAQSIAAANSITGGTIIVGGLIPSGRAYPPS